MRAYMLLSEIEECIEIAKESVQVQKRIYTYEEIKELEEKVSKKYSELYRRKVFKKYSLDGRRISRLHHTSIVMKYLKTVMEITGAKDTKYINFDMPGLSLEVLKVTDELGYIKHIESLNTSKENVLWESIAKRDDLLESKENEYGESFPSLFNYPEIREWYTENIYPLDQEIVDIANQVLVHYKKATLEDIKDVYHDEFLLSLHQKQYNKKR